MKNNAIYNFKKIVYTLFCTCILLAIAATNQIAQAQKVSITANFKTFDINKTKVDANNNATDVQYKGETSLSANLRIFDKNRFALRLGVGADNLKYEFTDTNTPIATNFSAVRQSLTAYLGLEKHFKIAFLNPYFGAYVPFTFNGNDKIEQIGGTVKQEIENGNVRTGLAVVTGANISLFKIFRLGMEANAGFDSFKEEVINPTINAGTSSLKLNKIDYALEFTFGVAF